MRWSQFNSGERDYDAMARAQAAYWWYADHHNGQWSREYMKLCSVSRVYSPGMLESDPNMSDAIALYDMKCDEHGCTHERLEIYGTEA